MDVSVEHLVEHGVDIPAEAVVETTQIVSPIVSAHIFEELVERIAQQVALHPHVERRQLLGHHHRITPLQGIGIAVQVGAAHQRLLKIDDLLVDARHIFVFLAQTVDQVGIAQPFLELLLLGPLRVDHAETVVAIDLTFANLLHVAQAEITVGIFEPNGHVLVHPFVHDLHLV